MKNTIMVVEDDVLMRESLFEILNDQGYTVVLAGQGEEALKKLTEQHVDVALIDLRLPGMTGIDFLKQARINHSSVDCIMMTSFATVETAVEAMKIGANDYLTKP